ncbi:MAG: 4-hydroxy-3-methylbut-2-enyl diphosphate reductase [Chloroflexota bacterium]
MPGTTMKPRIIIEKSPELGFCCGVKRAISLLEKAAGINGKIETLGPVVHNRQVVESLSKKGIRQVSSLGDVKGKLVAITAHGTDPVTLKAIQKRGLEVVDTTCTIVKSTQKAVSRFARAGYGIVIFGDPEHTEVKGLLGWSGEKAIATTKADDVAAWSETPRRLAIFSQSTQCQAGFRDFVKKVLSASFTRLREIHIVNTICQVTHQRQESAQELAGRCDLMLVVGGKNSANTRRLAETCAKEAETHSIETADEIYGDWLKGKKHIGIVAGTSTPDDIVVEVAARLKKLTSA